MEIKLYAIPASSMNKHALLAIAPVAAGAATLATGTLPRHAGWFLFEKFTKVK